MNAPPPVRSVAIITSLAFSVANFRGPMIARLVKLGIRVYALAPDYGEETRAAVRALGAEPVDISLERTGLRPWRDTVDMFRLVAVLRRLRPDLVFCYFIKAVIYGSIAARLAGVRSRYALVAGLGYVFTEDGSRETFVRVTLRVVAATLYRLAFLCCRSVFLQNGDDLHDLCRRGMLPSGKAVLVNGSGIDLAHFRPIIPVLSPITFVMVARLLREKGILEYVEAARQLKAKHPAARFLILGDVDSNPGGLPSEQVRGWADAGIIEWPGQVADVRLWLTRCSVFVLPSYREGKPRSTQEAMAMALPIVTTDAPGCRDTVEEGINGFKVPIRDAAALAAAMRRFIDDPTLIIAMGRESRRLAERLFDVDKINDVMIQTMQLKQVTPARERPITSL